MELTPYISFLIVSFGLIIIPGPNVLVIVSTSLAHGKLRGLQTVAGTSLAMLLQLLMVCIGTGWFIQQLSKGLETLKWLGIGYLLYLGLRHFKQAMTSHEAQNQISSISSFYRGFFISLSNPKTLLFFSAFLPQFVSSSENYFQQITILSGTFLSMAVVLDSCYALLAARFQSAFQQQHLQKFQHGLSGLLFFGAGIWLAVSRRG